MHTENEKFRGGRQTGMRVAAVVVLLTALAACSLPLPQAQSDPTKYFVLSTATTEASAPTAAAPVIRLRPVDLASYLRGRPMVVRRGENEIEFRDFARWGEPLEQGIARVLQQELLARGAASAVQVGSLRPTEVADARYELTVRVLACEGLANGGIAFHAVWELATSGDTPKVVGHGDYRAANVRWSSHNEASLAAALSRAVAGLAAEIASAVPKSD
ncbi:MAG TPA: PqiC family protein [Opitutaceae bacterium]|nr:PqiC family protein [Opitutaceae bacterium]